MTITPNTSEARAEEIFDALKDPFNFTPANLNQPTYTLPSQVGNPLYVTVPKVDLNDLATGQIDGTGAFERLMAAMKAELKSEFDKGRITGDQYTKAFIELTQLAMNTGLQFVMGKELSFWQAMAAKEQAKRAEIEAVTAAVQLETAKSMATFQKYQADTAQAQYALTKLQLASEDARYKILIENLDAAHAQVADNRMDGTPVHGTIERQRDLLEQQKAAFERDSDARVAKMYLDAWITQKTVNEDLNAPDQLVNAEINEVLVRMRNRAGLT